MNLADYANTLLAGMAASIGITAPAPSCRPPCMLTLIAEARDTLDAIEATYRRTGSGETATQDDRDDLWECGDSLTDAARNIAKHIEDL